MPVQDIHLVEGGNEIILAGADSLSVYQEWVRRYHPQRGTYTHQKLTEASLHADMILSGDMPAGFSDILDAADTIERGWQTTACWKIGADDPNFVRASKEAMLIFNVYNSPTAKALDGWKGKLLACGYQAELFEAIKPAWVDDIKPDEESK